MDTNLAWLVAGGVFLTILTLVGAAGMWLLRPRGEVGGQASGGEASGASGASVERVIATLGTLARPGDESQRSDLRTWLTQAGFNGRRTLAVYLATRGGFALAFPALVRAFVHPTASIHLIGLLLVAAAVGYYLPQFLVSMRRDARMHRMRVAFPNALDMLVSCLESGLGVDIALRHVATELDSVAPDICRELAIANSEMAAGVPRTEALRHLHERTGLEEVGSLVNELAQAERYGSRIAQALRAHAKMTRQRKVLDTERRAAEATPKLTVVMIVFVLPPLFVVVLGPTVVNLAEHFMPDVEAR